MELNISPQDIDKYVKDVLLQCTIGKNIKEGLEKSVKEIFSGYRNPVDEFVKAELSNIVREYMNRDEVKPIIIEAIAKAITPDAIQTIVNYGISEVARRYKEYNT